MSDPHVMLLRAVMERAGAGAAFIEGKAWDWATATFTGHRHLFRLTLPADAATRLRDDLRDAPPTLPGHVLAETSLRTADDGMTEIDALTIVA